VGEIVTISGTTCAGKTTAARMLIGQQEFRMVPSLTTRAKRDSDLPGEYVRVTGDELEELNLSGHLIWSVTYGDASYGTTFKSIAEVAKSDGRKGIMILTPDILPVLSEFMGNCFPSAKLFHFFLNSPPDDLLLERAKQRGDDLKKFASRLKQSAEWEAQANASHLQFHFVENVGTPQDMLTQFLQVLNG